MMILDPIDLLDVLGNENRRRILQLLSFRPFYFNEIAKRLDVGPKAVIDHLEMLENAGLIECYHAQGRRKYFRIARKTILEVAVTPHSYGVRAYRSEGVPQGAPCNSKDLKDLQSEISQVEEKRKCLRSQMEEIEAKEMELKRKAAFAIQIYADNVLEMEVLMALLSGGTSLATLTEKLEVPQAMIDDCLRRLQSKGAVQKKDEEWSI
jgi:ArsR family transcriptional regulator